MDVLDRNIRTMQEHVRSKGKQLRPHAKTHKCSRIVSRQLKAGCVGVCVAKTAEAEALVSLGIRKILVTSPVVTPRKIERLMSCVSRSPDVTVVVDHRENAERLSSEAQSRDLLIHVLVDIDGGLGRTGTPPASALELGQVISRLPGLQVQGIQCYAGHTQHISSFEERTRESLACMQKAAGVVREFREHGLPCAVFSGGGTGTYDIDCTIPELTDLQAGSYVMMDAEYLGIGGPSNPERFEAFPPALTLRTTVISANQTDFVTVDAGLKAVYHHGATPEVVGAQNLTYDWFGDEHGKVTASPDGKQPSVGTALDLIVSHCDPTVNLFDVLYVAKGNRIVDTWPIDLRGKSQ